MYSLMPIKNYDLLIPQKAPSLCFYKIYPSVPHLKMIFIEFPLVSFTFPALFVLFQNLSMIFLGEKGRFFHRHHTFVAPPPPPIAKPQVDAGAGAHREVTATLCWDAAGVAELEGIPGGLQGISQGVRGGKSWIFEKMVALDD